MSTRASRSATARRSGISATSSATSALGENVNIGQNVVVGPRVDVGNERQDPEQRLRLRGRHARGRRLLRPVLRVHQRQQPARRDRAQDEYRPTLVKRGASIGANATIVCGHTIGEYAFIAAGAVVATDVPAFALMAGVPARRIGWMSHAGASSAPTSICRESGRRYREIGPNHLEEIAP